MEWIERLNSAVEYMEAHLLEKTDYEKVADIALKYGYDSPTAFNRAFQSIHGIAPSAANEVFCFGTRYGGNEFHDLERRVITEWLPTSGYEYAEIPDIEVYIKADPKDAIYGTGCRL